MTILLSKGSSGSEASYASRKQTGLDKFTARDYMA
jgi:hypothetical protein